MVRRNGHASDCGCCAGVDAETPRRIENAPGKAEISCRVGNHARFKESLLARLSSSEYPALAALGVRDDCDFSIALCDALAASLDVLTFYQERIANEHYLRTATEVRSIMAMARLIGYVPSPGVAASAYLAFTLQDAPGDATQQAEPVTIPKRTRVQSVPGPDEKAKSFETVEEAIARVEWNSFAPQLSEPWCPNRGDRSLWLDGVATRLEPGDAILIVGKEREDDPGSERWDVRVVATVEPDIANRRTRVTWDDGLGHLYPYKGPASEGVRVFALRQRAALFGHNAPDPNLMSKGESSNLASLLRKKEGGKLVEPWEWASYEIDSSVMAIDLDAAYPKVTAGSWIALVSNEEGIGSSSLPGYVELYRAEAVRQLSRSDFGLSAKITRVRPDTNENLARFELRETLVLAQSEELTPVSRILPEPVYGDELALDLLIDGLLPDQPLALRGRRQRIAVAAGVTDLILSPDEGDDVELSEGDSLFLLETPVRVKGSTSESLSPAAFSEDLSGKDFKLRLRVLDRDGQEGSLTCKSSEIVLEASAKDDPEVMEIVFVASGSGSVRDTRDRTVLKLAESLAHCYERSTVRINANVVRATHGETVGEPVAEILGDGDASRKDQSFELRQAPLTYVSAATPTGRQSTLEVRVNDLLWTEVPTLYGRGGEERVYVVNTDDEGVATMRFGDGVEGARLPTGRGNVRAVYRKGLGVDGNVAAGKVTNLLSRPQGVKSAANPASAEGGEDRETLSAARENAPLSVLTLDRAVSVQDYADLARTFAGIAKAHALWIAAGPARGVFLTVAGVDGAAISETSATYEDLLEALRNYGDPLMPIHVVDHRPAVFRTGLAVKVADDHDSEKVLASVEDALRKNLGFDARAFGQGASKDEVMAIAHEVQGVEAVRVTSLYRPGPGVSPELQSRLFAEVPIASLTAMPEAAELLTLDDGVLELEELP